MPRLVDRDVRRKELAAALWRVVVTAGIEGTSVRSVAAESGCSPGALRHYFASQDELFRFAVKLLIDQITDRLQGHLAEPGEDSLELAVRLVEEFLPLDQTRRAECLVWYGSAERSRLDPELAQARIAGWNGTGWVARVAIALLAGDLEPAAGFASFVPGQRLADPELEAMAVRLHVLMDGWAVQGISYPELVSPDRLRGEVRSELQSYRDCLD